MSIDSLSTVQFISTKPDKVVELSSYRASVGEADRSHAAATRFPTVTIVIPTYNEAAQIERVVMGFLHTHYPRLLEVLIVDGGSTDGTQAIVQRLAQADSRVRLLHNPLKIQSAALNIGIADMQGEVFIRIDGHSEYAPDYIESCVETLLESGALNVGGRWQFACTTPFQAGIALAVRSILGAGRSKHRAADYEGYCDTVYLGCCWKKDLGRLSTSHLRPTLHSIVNGEPVLVRSYFDLAQAANQDAEINMRFHQLDDHAVYVTPRIRSWYYPRKSWRSLARQFVRYGRGRFRTSALHPRQAPLRTKLPAITGLITLILVLLDHGVFRGKLRTRQALVLGATVPFIEALRVTMCHRQSFVTEIWHGDPEQMPSLTQRWWYCSVALWTMTPAYLTGYIYQFIRRNILKIEGW